MYNVTVLTFRFALYHSPIATHRDYDVDFNAHFAAR